jgi:pimeloyl-ACP methyl ester carboxylesterase
MNFNRRELAVRIAALAVGTPALLEPLMAQQAAPAAAAADVDREFVDIRSEDKVSTWGLLYRPKGKRPRTAALIMHPNASFAEHFLTTRLAAQGYAVLGQTSRWLNNSADTIHESALLDIAAGIRLLKEHYGVERVVVIGHSAGGGLFGLYQVQATTPPPGRFRSTPAGDPPDLNQFDLPAANGLVSMSAPNGRGHMLLNWLDPAVVDESNPLATDWRLDIYDPRNGYRNPPESSTFSQEFIERFQAAQLARAKRLDAKAHAIIARQRSAAEQMKSPDFARLDPEQQLIVRRTALYEEYMVIYRTYACLESDLSYDPSDRMLSPAYWPGWPDPQARNYAGGGMRTYTPRSYLSTWSVLSSRVVTDENFAKITVPILVMGGTADNHVLLGVVRSGFEHAAAKDKTLSLVKGANHDYLPVEPVAGGKSTEDEAARVIGDWLRARFPIT